MVEVTKNKKRTRKSKVYDEDMGTIAICAVRYALGRESYMPRLVQDFVKRHPEIIDANIKAVMIRDINEADTIHECTLPSGEVMKVDGLGSTLIDRPGWVKFREWLKSIETEEVL